MKILLAVHHFPPRYKGGAEWRAYRTAAALQARGHQVRVVSVEQIDSSPDRGLTWRDELYDGIHVQRLSFNLSSAANPFVMQYNNPWLGAHFHDLFQQDRPDVFHLIGGYLLSGSVLQAAKECGLPAVVSLTDYWFLCPRISMLRSDGGLSTLPVDPRRCERCLAEDSRRYRLPARWLPQLADFYWSRRQGKAEKFQARLDYLLAVLNGVERIISPSNFLRSMYIQAGIDPQRIVYHRQGRDFPDLRPEQLMKSASPRLRVGYNGQVASHKGVHLLVEAVRRLPGLDLQLKIYGDLEPYHDYARQLKRAAGNDPRIEFSGAYLRGETSAVLGDLDVIVVPSVWYENSPNSILEAFAHRTPVIASDLGGMSELIQHGVNGLLFAHGSSADLALQIRRLVEDPALLPQLVSGIESVKSVAQEMDELVGIYQELACVP